MILDEIAEATRKRVDAEKRVVSLDEMKKRAFARTITMDFPFEKELRKPAISFICEVKKASPSKGIIAPAFDYIQIAREYENAGAGAISVLTEPDYFQGDIKYLSEIASEVTIPVLRKDFVIDEYMIYQAKTAGASVVLLICAILSADELKQFHEICNQLGLSAIVEAHDQQEVDMALRAGARILGVNNRDLKNFKVDATNCLRLRKYVPEDICFIAESGIRTREDIERLEQEHVNAVLIGETLMKSKDKKDMLNVLKGVEEC